MENRIKAPHESIETYRLVLDTSYSLYLFDTFSIPSIARNLIYMSKLDISDFDRYLKEYDE